MCGKLSLGIALEVSHCVPRVGGFSLLLARRNRSGRGFLTRHDGFALVLAEKKGGPGEDISDAKARSEHFFACEGEL